MRYFLTFVRAALFCAVLLLSEGCARKGVIGKKTMVSIVKEMYLADQYIEFNPNLRAQTDSVSVYPAIYAKYGYTTEDFNNSIKYYLQKSDTYVNILKQAMKEMEKEVDKLEERRFEEENQKVETVELKLEQWWALDAVRSVSANEFLYDPLLRGVRWFVLPDEKFEQWSIADTVGADIPLTSQWWVNNMEPASRSFTSYILQPEKKLKKPKRKPVVRIKAKNTSKSKYNRQMSSEEPLRK